MDNNKITIYDIASSVGVSAATVSRVIHKDSRISRKTTEKIFSKMRELNFTPRGYRERQKSGEKFRPAVPNLKTIYFISANNSLSFSNSIYALLANSLSDDNVRVISSLRKDFDINKVSSGDGVIYYGDPENLKELQKNNIPFVRILMQPEPGKCKYDHITYNNESVGVMAANYLIARGHKRVVAIGTVENRFIKTRFDFFRKKIEQAGGEMLLADAYFVSQESLGAVDVAIKDPVHRPTGFFVFNDEVAMMLYTYLNAIGINPGVDVEVISCNNSILLDNLKIKPASFELHLQQIASRSVEQLLWRMKNPKAQPNILIIEPELIST